MVFDSKGKLAWQNVVVSYKDPRGKKEWDGTPLSDVKPASVAPKGDEKGPVHEAWTHHFTAVGGEDVDKVMKDYTDSSIITVYNQADGSKRVFKGLADIKQFFIGLFESFFDTSGLAVPVQIVKEAPRGDFDFGGVFLIWSASASGYKTATETFIIDDKGKIQVQNVVFDYEKPDMRKAEEKFFVEPQIDILEPTSAMWLPLAGLAALLSVSIALATSWRRQLHQSTLDVEEAEGFSKNRHDLKQGLL